LVFIKWYTNFWKECFQSGTSNSLIGVSFIPIVSQFGDLSVENVSELNRIHIHAPCVNWSAGISYPHSRVCPLIGSFLLGFTYCDWRERESDRNVIFRCSFIGYFSPVFHIVTTGNVFLCSTMIQTRKNIKTLGNLISTRGATPPRTNQIASCFDALSLTWTIELKIINEINLYRTAFDYLCHTVKIQH
jgi:hypothetical protein